MLTKQVWQRGSQMWFWWLQSHLYLWRRCLDGGTLSPGLCCTPLKSQRPHTRAPTPPPAVSICEMHADPMMHLTPHLLLGRAHRTVSILRPGKEDGKPASSIPADTAFCPVGPPTEQTPVHNTCPSHPKAAQGRGLDPEVEILFKLNA